MSRKRAGNNDLKSGDPTPSKSLLEAARDRIAEERDLSSSNDTACYVAASMGQSPYVSLPGVGIIVVQKNGWGC